MNEFSIRCSIIFVYKKFLNFAQLMCNNPFSRYLDLRGYDAVGIRVRKRRLILRSDFFNNNKRLYLINFTSLRTNYTIKQQDDYPETFIIYKPGALQYIRDSIYTRNIKGVYALGFG